MLHVLSILLAWSSFLSLASSGLHFFSTILSKFLSSSGLCILYLSTLNADVKVFIETSRLNHSISLLCTLWEMLLNWSMMVRQPSMMGAWGRGGIAVRSPLQVDSQETAQRWLLKPPFLVGTGSPTNSSNPSSDIRPFIRVYWIHLAIRLLINLSVDRTWPDTCATCFLKPSALLAGWCTYVSMGLWHPFCHFEVTITCKAARRRLIPCNVL